MRREGLRLSGGGYIPLFGQVTEEAFDLGGAQTTRMAFVIENDEASYPFDIGLLGAIAVVAEVDRVTDLVQEAG